MPHYYPPPGFTIYQDGSKTVIVRKDYEQRLLRQGIASPDDLMAAFQSSGFVYSGRGAMLAVPIQDCSQEKMIIRKYRRGGLLRFVSRDVYWTRARPMQELAIGVEAALKGIPTSDILAAVRVKILGPFYKGYLISKELSSCRDLPAFLKMVAENAEHRMHKEKREVLARVAAAIRFMHDKGFYHGDLNLKNFLIDVADNKKVYIIDWDKSRLKTALKLSDRRKNILRFCRSMEKLRLQGLPITKRDQLFFLAAYWQTDQHAKKRLRKDYIHLKLTLSMRRWRWMIGKFFKNS